MRRIIIAVLAVLMLCTGCGKGERPGRVDTVVWIPVNPTEASNVEKETEITQTEASVFEETEPVTEPEETEAEKKNTSTGKKPSSNKGTSNKNNSTTKETKPKETEPEETKPQSTKPAAIEPPATEVPQPTETDPPETEPVSTEPAETEPDVTEPEATEPEATEPEATEPEATDPEDPLYDISGYVVGSLEYGIRDEINGSREESALSMDSRLCAIASCRANEISRVWSHTRPDGRHYSTVLADYGYGAGSVTELLVYVTGEGDAASIVSKWLELDSHRNSLLSSAYRTIGIGVYRSGGYTYVCCLLIN